MNEKRVYTFGNGKAEGNAKMREELGGKGANLAEMNLIGVPVPPKSPCQVHATSTPHTQQTVIRFPLPLSQDTRKTLVLM